MKGVLLFLAGVLVGANVVYFLLRGTAESAKPDAEAVPVAVSRATTPPPPSEPGTPAPATPAAVPEPTPAAARLLLPVEGIQPAQLHNTFDDARGDGSRTHEALDIMAPRGTPVLAAIDGSIEKLFTSDAGGLTIYQFDPQREHAYYYAHLDRYADGLAEGQAVRRGEVIGYVGSTGNANDDAPHLHFAIFKLGPEKRWWQGEAIDPYPLLAPGR